jgi:hypothetical protein
VRIGLRYHNVISAEILTKDLGRAVSEGEIFAKEFLRVPADLADMNGTTLTTEIRSPIPSPGLGSMSLRYGVTPSPSGSMCKIDMDRFVDKANGSQLGDLDLDSLLVQFSDDMSTLFRAASGSAWREWMKPKNPKGGT